MTRYFAATFAAALIGSMAVASAGASAHGFGMRSFETRPIVNTIVEKPVIAKFAAWEHREFFRDLRWRHRHVLVRPLVLGPGPALIP
jgi:hypothetical protein